jgi:hypothetical protein
MGTLNRKSVEFLTRPGCHLCTDAEASVRRAARWAGMGVENVDIESDDRLVADFGLRIPVVIAGGAVMAEGGIKGLGLWRSLLRHRFSRSG